MKKLFVIVFILLIHVQVVPQEHPYIVVKESEYEMLRERAERLPWSAMKAAAEKFVNTFEYEPDKYFRDYAYDISSLAGALALIAALEPERKPEVAEWMEDEVLTMLRIVREAKENSDTPEGHRQNVYPTAAAFHTYILLDIMYNDIDEEIRKDLEAQCDYIAGNHAEDWKSSKYGGEGMMALYHYGPESDEFLNKAEEYRDYVASYVTADGVYNSGPGYTFSRLLSDGRIQKKIFMDVCEYNGYHEFYDNPKFVNLYEWSLGYSVTPFGRTYTFGDSPPTKTYSGWSAAGLRANRFSRDAQAYAAWHIGEYDPEKAVGSILHFVLTDSLPVAPKLPPSRVFTNGGAWFIEDSQSSEALTAAVSSFATENESHSHYEVNAINIVGFGEHILRNVGYDGWRKPTPELWRWIKKSAEASNTVLIDHTNHTTFRGGGVIASILDEPVEYVVANSGDAIPNGEHNRYLYFVHPVNNIPGYFFLIDEARPSSGDDPVSVVLHPSSTQEPVVFAEKEHFRFAIKKDYNPGNEIFFDIYQVTQPESVEIRTGYMASYEENSQFYGKYLYSTYPGVEDAWTRAATILYPFTSTMDSTQFTRESTAEYDVADIKLSDDINDFLLIPRLDSEIEYRSVAMRGKAAYWRKLVSGCRVLSLTEGTKMLLDNEYGMTAESSISFVMTGLSATVISPGTSVTLKVPGLKTVTVEGETASGVEYGESEATIFLEKGTHKLTFE